MTVATEAQAGSAEGASAIAAQRGRASHTSWASQQGRPLSSDSTGSLDGPTVSHKMTSKATNRHPAGCQEGWAASPGPQWDWQEGLVGTRCRVSCEALEIPPSLQDTHHEGQWVSPALTKAVGYQGTSCKCSRKLSISLQNTKTILSGQRPPTEDHIVELQS